MRDDILYGGGILDDGWDELRDRLKTPSGEPYKLYYTTKVLPNEYARGYPLRYQRRNTFTCTFNDSYDDNSPISYTAQSYEIPMS